MATEDIFVPGKFTDLTDKQQLFLLNELLIQMLNRLNQIDPASVALTTLVGHDAGHVIVSNGVANSATWEETITLLGLTLSGLTASKVVATDASKKLATPTVLPAITTAGLTIGSGAAGVDYPLTFDGETNDGIVTWMEDEDYFQFSDDILIPSTERINFGDAGSSIRHDTAHLNLVDDDTIALGAPIIELGRNTTEDTTLNFMGDTNDGSIVWMEDENYFDFEDTVRAPSVHIDSDVAGLAATTTFTGVTDTPTADPGWAASSTIDMTVPDAYIKIYIGTQAYVIPAWLT